MRFKEFDRNNEVSFHILDRKTLLLSKCLCLMFKQYFLYFIFDISNHTFISSFDRLNSYFVKSIVFTKKCKSEKFVSN